MPPESDRLWTFLRDRISWFTQVWYATLSLFLKTEMQNHAAAVAYYFLLSIVPLILVLFLTFNWALSDYPELHAKFVTLFGSMDDLLDIHLPKTVDKSPEMGQLAGGISMITLIWSSKGLLYSVQSAFGIIFPDFGKRSTLSAVAISLLIVPLALLVVTLALCGSFLTDHLDHYLPENAFFRGMLTHAFHISSFMVPIFLVWYAIFTAYYRVMLRKPGLILTLASSILCTLSFLALKHFLIDNPQIEEYGQTYGAIGNIVFVLICVYSLFVIFFLWAQFLYSAGKIDAFCLEKIFMESRELTGFEKKLEDFFFKRSSRIFGKYGKTFKKNETVISQGELSTAVYYLYSGELGFYREQEKGRVKLGTLKSGELFGEMAYFLNESRTATVMAESDCFLFAISPEMLEVLLHDSPSLSRKIISLLCQRIYRSNPRPANHESGNALPVACPQENVL